MKINKAELLTALEAVKPALTTTEVVEQSTAFAFMQDRVVTFNDEISISYPINIGFSGAIKADELYRLLNKIKTEEVNLKITENQMIVKSGKATAKLILQHEIKMPIQEINEINKWQKLPEDFLQALKFVIGSAGTDSNKPILTCIHITNEFIESSDGFRISQYSFVKKAKIKNKLLIPVTSAQTIAMMQPVAIALTDGWAHFKTSSESVLSCRIYEGEYPDTTAFFKLTDSREINFPKDIYEIIDRAAIFSKGKVWLDEMVSISLSDNKIKIKGANDYGEFEEWTSIHYDYDAFEFHITPFLLKDIIKQQNVCEINDIKILFTLENSKYVAQLRHQQ